MKIGDLVKYKDALHSLQENNIGPLRECGMIVEEDGIKGWEACVYVMWGDNCVWEHVVNLEVLKE